MYNDFKLLFLLYHNSFPYLCVIFSNIYPQASRKSFTLIWSCIESKIVCRLCYKADLALEKPPKIRLFGGGLPCWSSRFVDRLIVNMGGSLSGYGSLYILADHMRFYNILRINKDKILFSVAYFFVLLVVSEDSMVFHSAGK